MFGKHKKKKHISTAQPKERFYEIYEEKWKVTTESESCFKSITGFDLKYKNRFTLAFQENIINAMRGEEAHSRMEHENFIAKFDFINKVLEIVPNVK